MKYLSFFFVLFLFACQSGESSKTQKPLLNKGQEQTAQEAGKSEVPKLKTFEAKAEKIEEKKKEEPLSTPVVEEVTKKKQPATKAPAKKKRVKKQPKKKQKGEMSFLSPVFDFGFIERGEVVDHSFRFTNTGKAPLEISNVEASCGCTQPMFPFLPIAPGETGAISVRFNSEGRLGGQEASLRVFSNAETPEIELTLKGTVREASNEVKDSLSPK